MDKTSRYLIRYEADFNELGAELDVDGVFLKIFLNELISDVEVLAEGLVGVEDGESVDGGQFTYAFISTLFSQKKFLYRCFGTISRLGQQGRS